MSTPNQVAGESLIVEPMISGRGDRREINTQKRNRHQTIGGDAQGARHGNAQMVGGQGVNNGQFNDLYPNQMGMTGGVGATSRG